jgi:hypothetical protein
LRLHGFDEGGVAHLQVVEPDLFAARQQADRERQGIEHEVPPRVLEPPQAVLGDALRALDDRPALLLVGGKCLLDPRGRGRLISGDAGHLVHDRACQRDGILHRELRARADGKVCRVRRVAEQHDVLVPPASVFDVQKLNPGRAIREERGMVNCLAEYALQVGDGLVGRRSLEVGGAERSLVTLGDERAGRLVEAVAVHLEEAMPVLLEEERKRLEKVGCTEPNVA